MSDVKGTTIFLGRGTQGRVATVSVDGTDYREEIASLDTNGNFGDLGRYDGIRWKTVAQYGQHPYEIVSVDALEPVYSSTTTGSDTVVHVWGQNIKSQYIYDYMYINQSAFHCNVGDFLLVKATNNPNYGRAFTIICNITKEKRHWELAHGRIFTK